jgi:dienelactone hydrolase
MVASAVTLAILAVQILKLSEQSVSQATEPHTSPIPTSRELWAGYDPRAEPLEVEIAKSWDEGNLHFDQVYFTGETWQETKVRVFAYRAAPKDGKKLPGVLHIHGGGQTASLGWARYWSGRGYVAVSHDFCGPGYGRAADHVTQWGKAPAYMADPNGPRSSLHPTARFNSWYHWILVARRSLTLLEQHPQADPRRLGIFGISVGGTLTWMVAGTDDRVAAAVPIYGVGQNTYTFPWQSPSDPADRDTLLTRALIEPEGYAARVSCPLLFMNASNDHHGRLDLGMRTLSLTTRSSMLREIYSPRDIHHISPAEAQDLPLWMDYHLKGAGPAWPASPTIHVTGGDATPRIAVKVDRPVDVAGVTIFYGLNNPWPTSRFYRVVTPAQVSSGLHMGVAPIFSADDTIYTFANVAYRSGIHLSTRLIKVAAKDLPGVRPSLERTALIDPMDDSKAWFWWLAGTDPYNQAQLLMPWDGSHGESGFTHATPGGFSFATSALGDPQFKRSGNEALLVDVWAESPPSSLVVGLATTFFQPGQVNYTAKPKWGEPKAGWWTLRFPPSDFKDEKGGALGSWKHVDFLYFQGQSKGQTKTVFKYLRWE